MIVSKTKYLSQFKRIFQIILIKFYILSISSIAVSSNLNKENFGGKIYYVSIWGNDTNSGLTEFLPWKTLKKVSDFKFLPGDIIRLRGGDKFEENLIFNNEDGTDDEPITITSYGNGKATIAPSSSNGKGITIIGRGGFIIENLKIVGDYNTETFKTKDSLGIGIYIFNLSKRKCSTIQIKSLNISNFKSKGIDIGGDSISSNGYTKIDISNCIIGNCGDKGINIWGLRYQNILISGNTIFNIHGFRPHFHGFSGNGISLAIVYNAVLERNLIFNNGKYAEHSGGGIVTGSSKNIIVRYNEIYGIKSNDIDGDGIDFDNGSDSCIAEYNYIHNVEGIGILISGEDKGSGSDCNVIRYNICKNAGLKNNQASIFIYSTSGADNNRIYNNTIINTSSKRNTSICLQIFGNTTNTYIYNNIFYSVNSSELLNVDNSKHLNLRFLANSYFTDGGDFIINWGRLKIDNFEDFIRSTGQEISENIVFGKYGNPKLINPLTTRDTINNPYSIDTLTAYKLLPESFLINNGINLDTISNPPSKDFYGTLLPEYGRVDIGAYEH